VNIPAIILVLAVGQSPIASPNDHSFRFAVESFIHDTGRVRDLDQVLPRSHAAKVRRLGCEHFECREAAEREIAGLGDIGWRAVVWGRWHKDAEIANRCGRLMTYLVCPACEGRNTCEDHEAFQWCGDCPWNESTHTRDYRCHTCNGNLRIPVPESE
jgi:hypothetical protein